MKQRVKFLAASILIAAGMILVSLFAASASQNFLFSSDLRVVEVEKYDSSSYLTVFDGETMVGNIYFGVEPGSIGASGQNRMTVSLSLFYNQTELDAVTIRFSGGTNIISVYREATSYTWEHQFSSEGAAVVFWVPDLGWYGQSTARLDFILLPNEADTLYLDMQLSAHRMTPLQLTSLNAQVHLDATIPKGNVTLS